MELDKLYRLYYGSSKVVPMRPNRSKLGYCENDLELGNIIVSKKSGKKYEKDGVENVQFELCLRLCCACARANKI